MRMPKYMSPSSLKTFERDREEYFLKYLAENRPDRLPQTMPMSVGSAFDAFVKSYLHYALFGHYGKNNEYERETIFENQVEEHVRDFAYAAGEHVFKCYSRCGALADLMFELGNAIGAPRFEFDIQGTIDGRAGAIPLLGKPDIFCINQYGARVIYDWKVNGYCGKSATSPCKGFLKVRDTWGGTERKPSRNNGQSHKDCVPEVFHGVRINGAMYLEDCDSGWADQLAIYGWLLGEEIGSESLIFGIDQIAGCGNNGDNKPFLRVASLRNRISSKYQFVLQERLNHAWNCITSGHIFDNLSREESDAKCKQLDDMANMLCSDDPLAQFVNRVSRRQ